MKQARARLIVEGVVQGVFFRANAVIAAKNCGVTGFVRNRPDGTVEAVIEGAEDKVKRLIDWCRIGPPAARVDRVNVEWQDFKDEFDDFTAMTRHNTY